MILNAISFNEISIWGRKQHTSARILKKFDWIGEEYFANEGSKEKEINLWY